MLLILINAAVVYLLLSAYSRLSRAGNKQNAVEIAVVSVIGLAILNVTVTPFLGAIVSVFCLAAWIFVAFHLLAKLPVLASIVSAVVILALNLLAKLAFLVFARQP